MTNPEQIREPRPTLLIFFAFGPWLRILDTRLPWAEWQKRRARRRDLTRLLRVGPHMIADIGLTLEDARREVAKPFWRS